MRCNNITGMNKKIIIYVAFIFIYILKLKECDQSQGLVCKGKYGAKKCL